MRRENIPQWQLDLRLILLATFAAFASACASTPENPHFQTMSESQIIDAVESQTQNRKLYDGFMNNLDVSATLTTEAVGRALLDQGARIYQWDPSAYANEKSKAESQRATETEVFLSFFVPERKWDDLAKSQSKWKIFLDANGRRYEGKAKLWKSQLVEVKSFYAHHTRWGTPYKVTFPVPTREVENTVSKLTLTGPIGTVNMEFKPSGMPAPALPVTEPGPIGSDPAPSEGEP
ncbi:MAG: hypothetical protein KF767_17380 [Bdellovibrionaceae bacterium]|nr:hypothetical protein [Pseudobdellovibrionaceae bacterium]